MIQTANRYWKLSTAFIFLLFMLLGTSISVAQNDISDEKDVSDSKDSEYLSLDFGLKRRYKNFDNILYIFQYKGYNHIKVANNVYLKHNDFFLVQETEIPSELILDSKYPKTEYPCLFLHSSRNVYSFSLHLAYFVTGEVLSSKSSPNIMTQYKLWKLRQNGEASKGDKDNTNLIAESEGWRALLY